MRPLPALFVLGLVAAVVATPAFRETIALYAALLAFLGLTLSWPSRVSDAVTSFLVSIHGGEAARPFIRDTRSRAVPRARRVLPSLRTLRFRRAA